MNKAADIQEFYKDYKLAHKMGEGAFGTVYKVKDRKDSSYQCALKILKKEGMD